MFLDDDWKSCERAMRPLASGSAGWQMRPWPPTPAERLTLVKQLSPPGTPAPDRPFTVPYQCPRHRPQTRDQPPPPGELVGGAPRGDQQRRQPARIGADHGQHRQLGRFAGLAEPHRQLDRRKPQVALGRSHRPHTRCARPDLAADTPPQLGPTRAESTRIERVHPIRSAITVGHRRPRHKGTTGTADCGISAGKLIRSDWRSGQTLM